MKTIFVIAFLFSLNIALAQKASQPARGTLYGQKVDSLDKMPATKVEAYMGKRTRISTTLTGKVIKVTQTKGGWFDMDAGSGKVIKVHFKNYGINLPVSLAGHWVMIQGVAQKQLIADEMQHFAGDTVKGASQHNVKVNPKQQLTFEATGVMVL